LLYLSEHRIGDVVVWSVDFSVDPGGLELFDLRVLVETNGSVLAVSREEGSDDGDVLERAKARISGSTVASADQRDDLRGNEAGSTVKRDEHLEQDLLPCACGGRAATAGNIVSELEHGNDQRFVQLDRRPPAGMNFLLELPEVARRCRS
jgi:hypothetical protein